MFERNINYPAAVVSYDDEGVAAAINWCAEHLEDGGTVSVWTPLKSDLENCAELEQFVLRHSDVVHITGRGGMTPADTGPVLMASPDMDDIGKFVRYGRRMTALCVITLAPDQIRAWVTLMKPEILGDGSEWQNLSPNPDPFVVEALKGLTPTVSHSNTIAAGLEKDQVISVLLALHAAGVSLDADAMQGWVLTHGWSGKNPERLAQYVRDINGGKRPRAQRAFRPDYIETLRKRIASSSDGD